MTAGTAFHSVRRRWRASIGARALVFFGAFAIAPSDARALDAANVLPAQINSPAIRAGVVSGIGARYDSTGTLRSLSDVNSISFDSRQLSRIEPRVRDLVTALNQFGRQGLGDALNLGVLRVETRPEVRYLAPLHAYGVNRNLTVAFGLPVVTYTNQLSLSQSGSNIDAIQGQVGRTVPQLNDAFGQLRTSIVTAVNRELEEKGYRPLQNRNETIVGDAQLAALYRFFDRPRFSAMSRTLVNLPTGPADDPDDLADLNIFGETALEQGFLINAYPIPQLRLAGRLSYRWVIPDHATRRIPESEGDALPGADRKERLRRDRGDTATLGTSATFRYLRDFSVGAGIEGNVRGGDTFSGNKGWRYDLLERNTAGRSARMRLYADWDTTRAYFSQQAAVPAIVAYEFSDTVAGRNVERQSIHELWVTLFF